MTRFLMTKMIKSYKKSTFWIGIFSCLSFSQRIGEASAGGYVCRDGLGAKTLSQTQLTVVLQDPGSAHHSAVREPQ